MVYTVPMDSETVESRLMSTDAKRAILANMRAAARGQNNEYDEELVTVEAPQPQPSPQQQEREQELPPPPPPPPQQPVEQASRAVPAAPDQVLEPAPWGLDCGSLGWLMGAVEGDPKCAKPARSPLPLRAPSL